MIYPFLTFAIHYNYCKKADKRLLNDLPKEDSDEKNKDVEAEEQRAQKILNGEIEPETITVHKLMKRFKTIAVKKSKKKS